jgi:hypothetical protein
MLVTSSRTFHRFCRPCRHILLLASIASTFFVTRGARASGDRDACVEAYEGAQQLRRVNDLVVARDALLRCEATCPVKFASDCSAWRREVESFLPSVLVSAQEADGTPVDIGALFVDGRRVDPPPKTPLWLAPGNHVLRVHSERGSGELTVSLRAEEHDRQIVVVVRGPEAARPVTEAADSTTRPRNSDGASSPSGRSKVPSFALLGLGSAALATAGILTVAGHVERARLEQACSPDCTRDEVSAVRTTWWVAGALGVGGAAALAVAWLVWPGSGSRSGLRVGPRNASFVTTF